MVAGLDLSGLEQFRASALMEMPVVASKTEVAAAAVGQPENVPLDLIDFDPLQPRRSLNARSLGELAASVAKVGVLEPVSLRRHPEQAGRYMVNRGERRVRASRLAGETAVPAWFDEVLDRYAQALENLQREDLTPFDLAVFVAEREREGDSRTVIAERLQKPASFITEVAGLVDALEPVKAAFESGRSRDTRVLYRLARAIRQDPGSAEQLLAGDGPIRRDSVPTVPGSRRGPPELDAPQGSAASASATTVQASKRADALLVEHAGKRGRLCWRGWPGRRTGDVRYEDGSQRVVDLSEVKVIAWTAR